jgi:hypothetical protein
MLPIRFLPRLFKDAEKQERGRAYTESLLGHDVDKCDAAHKDWK